MRWIEIRSLSLLHDIDKGIFVDLDFPNSSKLLFPLFISLEQFSFSAVISSIAFCCNVFFYMRNLFFCNRFSSNSGLDTDCKKLGWNLIFELCTNGFSKIVGFLIVDKESQGINGIVHDMNDHFNDICLSKPMVFIFKRSITMRYWLDFINKINNYLGKR